MPDEPHLLLVEDNPGDARFFREMLRDLGYGSKAVEHVGTVREALGALGTGAFDIVFLDLDLPDERGLDTVSAVLDAGFDVPVVVLTGLADEAIGTRAVERGAQDYLVKGEIHADVLARVVRYACGRHQAVAVAKRESARAAAAEARLRALEESRETLEREVAVRRAAQAELEGALTRLQAFRRIDRAIIANSELDPTLAVVLRQGVELLSVDAAAVLLRGEDGAFVPAAEHGAPGLTCSEARLEAEDPAIAEALRAGSATFEARADDPSAFGRAAAMRGGGFRGLHLVPLFAREELLGVLELFSCEPLAPTSEWREDATALAGQAAVAVDGVRLQQGLVDANRHLVAAYDDTIQGWSRALDLRDRETEGHSRRVTELSVRLAREFGVDEEALAHLRRGALLHDIGKMGVPDAILQKPGPLDEREWVVMRRHPTLARDLLAPIAYLRPALDIPYAHHERWDGSGYPRGLKGREIPLAARLFAVADVYDALTSDRPYRRAWPAARAVEYVVEKSGELFDPEVVETFLRVIETRAAPEPPTYRAVGSE